MLNDMLGSAMAVTAGTFQVDLDNVVAHGLHLAAAFVRRSATRAGEEPFFAG